ncbi:MAG: TerB family tellurite resistance protein [SAR324 cluster bacterium]|nr:TerB family tellurite resistance protein [SAR324 cluster bacterium]
MARAKPVDMLDVRKIPWQKKRDYLTLVAAVAASDGALHPDELALLERWMAQFSLAEKSRQVVLAAAKQESLSLEAIKRRLAKTDLVYSLMLDMMGMAMADGVLMDEEILLLNDVAASLRLDPLDFGILIEFVHSAHQASLLNNPEPLYEHNIDCAFQLLHQKKVRLFPHTLLCVSSPEYDRHLKERWSNFQLN